MLKRHQLYLILIPLSFFLVAFSCGVDVEDPDPPSIPQWIPKTLPEEWPERGIDAHESGGIYLEWYPNPEDDISGYHLYRAQYFKNDDSLGEFSQIAFIDIKNFDDTEYTDGELHVNTDYKYTLQAEDVSGNLSENSDTLSYGRLAGIVYATLNPNSRTSILNTKRELEWGFEDYFTMEDYTITILDSMRSLIYRTSFYPSTYTGETDYWKIPDSVLLIDDMLYLWRLDMGAAYNKGYETQGFETQWAYFKYQTE